MSFVKFFLSRRPYVQQNFVWGSPWGPFGKNFIEYILVPPLEALLGYKKRLLETPYSLLLGVHISITFMDSRMILRHWVFTPPWNGNPHRQFQPHLPLLFPPTLSPVHPISHYLSLLTSGSSLKSIPFQPPRETTELPLHLCSLPNLSNYSLVIIYIIANFPLHVKSDISEFQVDCLTTLWRTTILIL